MRHLLILILLLSTLSFIGCKDESEATYLIDRAESLLKSDPDSSLILLDSIAVPDNLSDKLLARWCMLSGKVADTLYTDLPYVQQLRRAQAYYESHGTGQEPPGCVLPSPSVISGNGGWLINNITKIPTAINSKAMANNG